MRRRLIKATAYGIMSMLAVLLAVAVAFYARLASGPVSLDFMTETFQEQINSNLSGMKVEIGGALIERAADSGIPHFRLSDIRLFDTEGSMIARAPRAAIGIDEGQLLTGRVVPVSLELIGPRIRIKRTIGGGIELGFGEAAAAEDEVAVIDESTDAGSGKTDQEPATAEGAFGQTLIAILAGDAAAPGTTINALESIHVTGAAIKFYDEANDAIWDAPRAELAFRRMPYGFAVVVNAAVSNGNETGEWNTEISASYRRETRSFAVSARVDGLVPANISDEVYALAQLARFKVPLSGHAEMEISDQGQLTKASAEFIASAGEVSFPDYLPEPIIVDEGSLRADYDPVTGGIVIADSQLLAGGSRAQITGYLQPVRNEEGYLSAIKVSLNARNVALDPQGTVRSPVAVDRVDFVGSAAINEAKLDIDDLTLMSGDTGIRLRGTLSGGGESAGILVSGRIRDLSADLLKKLWPPIMTPKTRAWVFQNIIAGRITEGEFQVNLPVDAIAKAQRDRRLPAKAVRMTLRLADVSTRYFRDLPPLLAGSGEARLVDNDFNLTLDGAMIELPSGQKGKITSGTMVANGILAGEVIGEFNFGVAASAPAVVEYIGLPDLKLMRHSGFDTSKLSGDAQVNASLVLPMIKNAPKERIKFAAKATLADAAIAGALPSIDITNGKMEVTVSGGQLLAKGPAKINGVPVQLTWERAAGPEGGQSAIIEANLSDDERKKIGINLSEFMKGPVEVKATIPNLGDPQGRMNVEVDLAAAEMNISAISWSREATKKTTATFSYFSKGEKGRRIEDLVIKGPGLTIKGGVALGEKNAFKQAKLSEVRLSDENIFALTIVSGESGTTIKLKGDSFDARPLITSMFSTRRGKDKDGGKSKPLPMDITVDVDRIHAHRGEILSGVTASIKSRGDKVAEAEINGTFLSGQPVVLRIVPVADGREMRITGRDGGAALRAANLYSKVAGGAIEFYALMANDANSSVKNGKLVLRNFEVRNEAALAQLDSRGKPKKSGPRKESIAFKKLTLPFTTDAKFVRLGDSLVRGDELGATAEGIIRKGDGAIDITGTIIPLYGPNAALGNIPLLGDILTGGNGEGIFGLTYALGGNMNEPVFQVNPVSAIAPGIFRKMFEYSDGGEAPQQSSRNPDKINQ